MRASCFPALLLLLPGLASAQTSGIALPGAVARDVNVGLTSAALVEDVTALHVNPAGLTFARGPQLQYFHESNTAHDWTGNAIYAGASAFGAVGLAVGHQWLGGTGVTAFRQTSVGLSLGSPSLSIGASLDVYSGNETFGGLTSFDVGLAGRPLPFLSYGLTFRDLGSPERSGTVFHSRVDAAVGVRPFPDWDGVVAIDYLAALRTLEDARLTYTLQAPVIPGVTLGAGVTHGVLPGRPVQAQASVTLDARALGATYAPGLTSDGFDHVLGVRVGGQAYPGVSLSDGVVALFRLSELTAKDTSLGALVGLGSDVDPYLKLLRTLELAERDPQLRGVVIEVDGSADLGLGRAMELHQALRRLRQRGKTVVARILRADDTAYLVASAADRIWAAPEATLTINGLSASITLLGGAMDKLGVRWDVARQGAFKTAPEQLTRSEPSEAQRETINALLDSESRQLVTRIAEARGRTLAQVHAALAEGLLTPRRAVEVGLVDALKSGKELDRGLDELMPGAVYRPDYQPLQHRRPYWGIPPRIAVIPILGNITGGESAEDPLGLQRSAGAATVIRAIQRASGDPGVRAIVLRIDSPGGDALASDLIYRAVLEAREHKPVIASMGDVAASGGYYAAMGADEIHALPTTVTGSIGVFLVKPAVKDLGEKLQIHRETLKRAPLADLLDVWSSWSPEAQLAAQRWVDAFYDDFITEVSKRRKLGKDAVHAVAQGRVWSGEAALSHRLVDQLGDLSTAVAAARRRAKLSPSTRVQLEIHGEVGGLFNPVPGMPDVLHASIPRPASPLPAGLTSLVRELGASAVELEMSGLQARLPFTLEVR